MPDKLDSLVKSNSGSMPSRQSAGGFDQQATKDLLDQLVSNQDRIDKLLEARNNVPGAGSALKSLPGILAMLGTGAAAASGAPDAGASLMNGFIGQVEQKQAAEQERIDAVRDDTMKLLEANRQRLTTMLTNRPELFIDDKTGMSMVDPRALMYAATGMAMPIDPGINYRLQKQTDRVRTMVEVGTNMILNGDTPDKRRQGGAMVDNALGLDLGPDFYDAIVGMDESNAWISVLTNNNLDTNASLHAWTYARQNGLPMADPTVIGMLAPATDTGAGGKFTIEDKELALLGELNKFGQAAGPDFAMLPLEDQIDLAFGERTGDVSLLKQRLMGNDAFGTGLSGDNVLASLNMSAQFLTTLYSLPQFRPVLEKMGITSPMQIWSNNGVGGLAASTIKAAQNATRDAFAQKYGYSIRRVAQTFTGDMDGPTRMAKAIEIVNAIRDKATSQASGQVDVDAFIKGVNEYVGQGAAQ